MKLTKSQTVYLSALGIAVVALGLDQLFGSGSPAAPASSVASIAQSSAVMINSEPTPSAGRDDVAQKLSDLSQRLSPFTDIRDAFTASPRWFSTSSGDATDAHDRSIHFQTSHQLKAIIARRSATNGQVLIDDTLLSVGQSIDGFQLVAIERMSAIFTDGATRIGLSLSGVDLRNSSQPTKQN